MAPASSRACARSRPRRSSNHAPETVAAKSGGSCSPSASAATSASSGRSRIASRAYHSVIGTAYSSSCSSTTSRLERRSASAAARSPRCACTNARCATADAKPSTEPRARASRSISSASAAAASSASTKTSAHTACGSRFDSGPTSARKRPPSRPRATSAGTRSSRSPRVAVRVARTSASGRPPPPRSASPSNAANRSSWRPSGRGSLVAKLTHRAFACAASGLSSSPRSSSADESRSNAGVQWPPNASSTPSATDSRARVPGSVA